MDLQIKQKSPVDPSHFAPGDVRTALEKNFRAALGINAGPDCQDEFKSGNVGGFWEKLADVYYQIPDADPRKQAIFKLERQIIKKREEKKELKDSS